jgi:hypothetical protein
MADEPTQPTVPPVRHHSETPGFLSGPTPPEVIAEAEERALKAQLEANSLRNELEKKKSFHDLMSGLGHVASNWSYFEAVIDDWSMRLAGISADIGVCFTSQISGHARKFDALVSIARLKGASKQDIAEICAFIKDTCMPLAERRNRMVHDPWFTNTLGEHQKLEASARKKLLIEYKTYTPNDLISLANDIDSCRDKFDEWATRVWEKSLSSTNTT